MSDRSCETCAAFAPWPDRKPEEAGAGECRRHAPRFASVLEDGEPAYFQSGWPSVEGDAWCMEWERR